MTGSSAPPEGPLADLRARVLAARDRLRGLPAGLSDRRGPPDPSTGERWEARNVLGHMAEMLPFWLSELRGSLRGGAVGRDEEGYRRRRGAIESGPATSERELRLRVDRGCGRLLAFLDRLEDRDLARRVRRRPEGETTLGEALEALLVGHLEAHVDQLESLTSEA